MPCAWATLNAALAIVNAIAKGSSQRMPPESHGAALTGRVRAWEGTAVAAGKGGQVGHMLGVMRQGGDRISGERKKQTLSSCFERDALTISGGRDLCR